MKDLVIRQRWTSQPSIAGAALPPASMSKTEGCCRNVLFRRPPVPCAALVRPAAVSVSRTPRGLGPRQPSGALGRSQASRKRPRWIGAAVRNAVAPTMDRYRLAVARSTKEPGVRWCHTRRQTVKTKSAPLSNCELASDLLTTPAPLFVRAAVPHLAGIPLSNPGLVEMCVFDGLARWPVGWIKPGLALLLMEAIADMQGPIPRLDD